jgi:LPXTG-motif cell wall-anchored protein
MKKLFVSATVVGIIFAGALPASATFNVVEPFSTEGALSTDWITSGTVLPNVARHEGDTPANALRLTSNDYYQNGFALYNKPFNLSQGVQFDFTQYQWGGNGADGLVFFIKNAADGTNVAGGLGGSLGYSPDGDGNSVPGISGALLGVGIDAYGNFNFYGGSGCQVVAPTDPENPDGNRITNQITVRGPGQDFAGYCLLSDAYDLAANGKKLIADEYATRQASAASVRINIDSPFIESPRVKVYYEDFLVQDVPLPSQFRDTVDIKFGFTAGTGSLTNNNEISDLRVKTLDKSLPFRDVASSVFLANTGGSLANYYLLFGAALILIVGGIFSSRKGKQTAR